MITEAEFLHAVNTIICYRQQIQKAIDQSLMMPKIKIEDALKSRFEISRRLARALKYLNEFDEFNYLEDIKREDLLKLPKIGTNSWLELEYLKKEIIPPPQTK